jgi:hypothetical protein
VSGVEVRIIDHLEQSGEGLAHHAKRLQGKRYRATPITCSHTTPRCGSSATGKTRAEVLRGFGLSAVRVLPQLPVADGIEQARLLLPKCYFDLDACRPLVRALESHRKDWDEARKTFALRPRHNWASHGAHAFRYLAMGLRPGRLAPRLPIKILPPSYSFTRGATETSIPGDPYRRR